MFSLWCSKLIEKQLKKNVTPSFYKITHFLYHGIIFQYFKATNHEGMRFERVVFLDALSGSSASSMALDKRFAPFFLLFVAFARFRWPPLGFC